MNKTDIKAFEKKLDLIDAFGFKDSRLVDETGMG